MKFKKATIISITAIVLIALTFTVVTAGVLVTQKKVPSSGNLGGKVVSSVNVGVYSDASATTVCSSVDWGSLNPGGSVTRTVYVKNTGNTDITVNLSTSGWAPSSASSILTLTWNKEGATLAAGSVVAATLTLKVAQNTGSLNDFSFNIVISGSAK